MSDTRDPLVSIVTPSYNQAQYLEATILSVLSQDYPRLEYLIVDGGSTDGSVEIVRRYAPRLAYWVSEADGGQAEAINKGWQLARGEIVAYLNSDDLYLPGAVSRVVQRFHAHPDVSVMYGSYRLLDGRSEVIRGEVVPPDWSESTFLNCFPQPTAFFRHDALRRVGYLDTSFHYSMDYDLFVRLALAGSQASRVPGPPLAAVRIWEGAKSSNRSERGVVEDFQIFARVAADPRLPKKMLGRLPYVKASACLWPAYESYALGDIRSARRYLSLALQQSRRIVASPQFVGLCLRTILGTKGSRLVRTIKAWFLRHASFKRRSQVSN